MINMCDCGSKQSVCLDCNLTICDNNKGLCVQNEYFCMIFGKNHQKCVDCGKYWVCHPNRSNCVECSEAFVWINDEIAVGSANAQYAPFDLVVNLNYPLNDCALGTCHDKGNILCVGVSNEESNESTAAMARAISMISAWLSVRKPLESKSKLLIHCGSHKWCRSVTVGVYYLSKRYHVSTKTAFEWIKYKVSCVHLNHYFAAMLDL